MTEDEAKTKFCCGAPFIATAIVISGKAGSVTDEARLGKCIGSACMAWRWNEPWTSRTEEGHGGDIVVRLARKPGQPKLGYCGLAGEPS